MDHVAAAWQERCFDESSPGVVEKLETISEILHEYDPEFYNYLRVFPTLLRPEPCCTLTHDILALLRPPSRCHFLAVVPMGLSQATWGLIT